MEAKLKNSLNNEIDCENETPIEPLAKTMAFLQLTRIGDILQTIQVVQELREHRPELRLIFIGREKFAKPLKFLLDQVFDKSYYLNPYHFDKKDKASLQGYLLGQKEFINEISAQNIEVLVNLSFSRTSAHLAKIIKANHKLGLVTQDDGLDLATDKWSQYTHSSVQTGSFNAFSLVDIYRMIVGVHYNPPAQARKAHQRDSKEIVIHPFSSHRKKNWKPEKWVEIIYKTLKTHDEYRIHLVGAKSDLDAAEKILSHPLLKSFKDRIFQHAGKQNIEYVWNLICDSALFIGHDSMVGHLAALARTQSLTLSLGTVRPYETTPYTVGSYSLAPRTKCFPCFPSDSCELLQCHSDISYHLVCDSIDQLLQTGEVDFDKTNKNINSFHLATAEIYKTIKTEANLLSLKNINHDSAPSMKHVVQGIGRIVWLFMLQEAEEEMSFFHLNEKTIIDINVQMDGLKNLNQLCEFGKKYCRYILEEIASPTVDMTKLKDYSTKLDEIDQMSNSLLKIYPALRPIVSFLAIQKSCLAGDNIVQMSESAYLAYDRGSVLSKLFSELLSNNIQHSVNKYKKAQQTRQDAL